MLPETGDSFAGVAAAWGITPEMISAGVVFIAPLLVSPLAAIWKRWRGTTGPDTRMVIKVLTALVVGLGGFLMGLYGYNVRGLVNALLAAVLAYLKTTGDYERDVNVQVKADRKGAPGTASASDVPGTEQPASFNDVEAEMTRQTGIYPAPAFADDAPLSTSRL